MHFHKNVTHLSLSNLEYRTKYEKELVEFSQQLHPKKVADEKPVEFLINIIFANLVLRQLGWAGLARLHTNGEWMQVITDDVVCSLYVTHLQISPNLMSSAHIVCSSIYYCQEHVCSCDISHAVG